MAPELHPNLVDLAPLLGTWSGRGVGMYPTIETFEYLEEISFTHVGKPFLSYRQKTRAMADGRPLHAEAGYLQVPEPGRLEWVLAHPTGITEIQAGTYSVVDAVITAEMAATAIGLSPTAKEVTALERSVRVDGDELSYTLRMGAVGQHAQDHLSATLLRQPG
ncbi:peroxynitrite isomerase [Mycobacterium sp. 1274756.6]|uniref:peroxynitrite isomerase n=1 Tax=Mycobacterium sp. 1274756.6 TaxID=1834076 RepID=UPI0007FE31DD|nr:FABP family protein [Mycobacterium sp. 1274756.6]OBJ71386.1 fatty acid-binding-like protein [Mycobacterium sp. 1274756.6]